MKNLLLLLAFMALKISAQDILTYKDGTTSSVKVILVSNTEVRYKLFTHLHGPTYKASCDELYSIIYEDGNIQKFESVQRHTNTKNREQTVEDIHIDSDFEEQIDLYIQNGWGIGFTHRKNINQVVGWNMLGVSFMSGWNSPEDFGIVNVRGLGFRLHDFLSDSWGLYSEINIGYTFIYANDYNAKVNGMLGNTYNLNLNGKAHCFAFDFSAGFQISEHLGIGYNLTYLKNKDASGAMHWGKITLLF